MEQLCGSMAMMDNEGFIRVLGDLMAQNKVSNYDYCAFR